ncbi:MAG: DUF4249 domain-containing protein [Rikenellaceae bacterium]|nr:DUF4249 domain-containing protein [Rikenellaceae bacterium]
MTAHKYIAALGLLLLTACEKEITLPYRSVDPLYVIEGMVTDQMMEVLITNTIDMDDGSSPRSIPDAVVEIYADDGSSWSLFYDDDGYYRPASAATGTPGLTYTLSVGIDGRTYKSSSLMGTSVEIFQIYFQWLSVLNERVLFFTFIFRDIAGEDNYYCYRIRRNGESYRWNVMHDRGNDGELVLMNVYCVAEKTAKENKEEDWKDILYEGDRIELEIQSIDKRTYDYLYSVGLSERTSANPIDNFSGGCLGYFSAYTSSRRAIDFTWDFDQWGLPK